MNKLTLPDAGPPAGIDLVSYERLDANELLVIVDGASGVGKSTSAAELCRRGIIDATPTWTTRQPRPGETSTSYDHLFVSDEEFDRYDAEGGFITQRVLYGNRYGMPYPRKPEPGREAFMILKPAFILPLLAQYPYTRIHHIEASQDKTEDRMRLRGQTDEDIAERLNHHDTETEAARHHSHTSVDNNGPLEETVAALEEHIRLDRRGYDLLQLLMAQV